MVHLEMRMGLHCENNWSSQREGDRNTTDDAPHAYTYVPVSQINCKCYYRFFQFIN